ncbi:hypothetical protein [Paenibacillus agricola]|uniref:Phytanoyl-CoA dioxygenase n=1 Tax=Paenibacillus agricola TaxID=2716264 RepID=A0ABX0JL40_9BACL|nr:hypothetical protein [Paenibacillus agricola]NHN35394.1 hypothetical protein [Paenibacillus agricola]
MENKVLTDAQVQHFIEKGWVKLEQAFPRENALAAQDVVWNYFKQQFGMDKHDRSTWKKPRIHLTNIQETQKFYDRPEFMVCNTELLFDAIEDLVGRGRCINTGVPNARFGTMAVSVYSDVPWDVPTTGWHYDGDFFTHYVDSLEQGLLVLCLFSDIAGPQCGGTLLVEGSHNIVAKVLHENPDGLHHREANKKVIESDPWLRELVGLTEKDPGTNRIQKFMNQTYEDPNGFQLRVIEPTGNAGDIVLCHPFVLHAASVNTLGTPRFLGNRRNQLTRRMKLHRENQAEYSPVELVIRNALFKDTKAPSV